MKQQNPDKLRSPKSLFPGRASPKTKPRFYFIISIVAHTKINQGNVNTAGKIPEVMVRNEICMNSSFPSTVLGKHKLKKPF